MALYQGQGPVGSREAVERNLERLVEVTALAAGYDCQAVVFPEKYTTGYAIGPEECGSWPSTARAPPSSGPGWRPRSTDWPWSCPTPSGTRARSKTRSA